MTMPKHHLEVIPLIVLTALVSLLQSSSAFGQQNRQPAVDVKVEDLLRQMTLDEKIGQMTQVDMNGMKNKADIQKYFIGSMLSGGGSDPADITAAGWAKAYDEFQSWALKTRLAIPLIYGIDAVHGHNNVDGAVIFPHNIGLGATRNAELVEKAARATAVEIAGTGMNWAFAPCIAVRTIRAGDALMKASANRPNWQRCSVRRQFVDCRGKISQSRLRSSPAPSIFSATAARPAGRIKAIPSAMRRRCAIHLPGYAAAIKANVGTIMVSYNSWNGQKMHGNKLLLDRLAERGAWFPRIFDFRLGRHRSALTEL